MTSPTRSRLATAKAVVDTAQEQQITFLAASVAYYAFVSLLPALLLLLVLASTIGGEAFAEQIVGATQEFLTPAGEDAISGAIEDAPGRGGATIVGVGVLIWSTLKVFRALDTAFVAVYGDTETLGFLSQLKDALIVLVGISVGVGVMIVAGTILAALPLGPASQVVSILALPAVLTVAFLPMYYYFPNQPISLGEAVPGAVFAGVGWTLLQAGFQIYAAGAAQYEAYGVIGGILLLVTWLYFAAIILILGAVLNAVRGVSEPSSPPFSTETDGSGRGRRQPTGSYNRRAAVIQHIIWRVRDVRRRQTPKSRRVLARTTTASSHGGPPTSAKSTTGSTNSDRSSTPSRLTFGSERSTNPASNPNSKATSGRGCDGATPVAGARISSCCTERG